MTTFRSQRFGVFFIFLGTFLYFSIVLCPASDSALTLPLTYAKIKNLVDNENIQSIECLLSKLPPEFTEHQMLFHSSRGLQDSTFQAPRAVVYGPDAKFVMAFNGDPGQFRYEFLEMIEYNENAPEDESPFALFEMQFPANEKFDFAMDEPCKTLPGKENRADTTIPKNPIKCLGCHSNFPGPIFEAHPLMPGAYGEMADVLHNKPISEEGRSNDRIRDNTKIESEEIIQFISRAKNHPRYGYLHDLDYSPKSGIRHNGRLQQLFSELNFERILRVLKTSSLPGADTPLYRYYFMSIFNRCFADEDEFKKFMPTNTTLADLDPILYNVYTPERAQTDLIFNRFFEGLGISTYGMYTGFDISERLGFETATDFNFNGPNGQTRLNWLNELYSVFGKADAETASLFHFIQTDNLTLNLKDRHYAIPKNKATFCTDLKNRISQLLGSLDRNFSRPDESTAPEVRFIRPQSCLKCHTGENRVADLEIPFLKSRTEFEAWALKDEGHWAKRLHSYVKKDSSGKSRMPVRSGLTADEIAKYDNEEYDILIRYLEQLVAKSPPTSALSTASPDW